MKLYSPHRILALTLLLAVQAKGSICDDALKVIKDYQYDLELYSQRLSYSDCDSSTFEDINPKVNRITNKLVDSFVLQYMNPNSNIAQCESAIEPARFNAEKTLAKVRTLGRACAANVKTSKPCAELAMPQALNGANSSEILKVGKDLARFARSRTKETCEWIRMGNLAAGDPTISEQFAAYQKKGDLLGAAKFMLPKIPVRSLWQSSLAGHSFLKIGYGTGVEFFPKASLDEIQSMLREPLTDETFSRPSINLKKEDGYPQIPSYMPIAACASVKLKLALECPKALEKNLEEMIPQNSNGASTTAAAEFREIFSDRRYATPLRSIANKMIDRLKDPVLTQGTNLFDDVKNEFLKSNSGFTRQEAEDAAWKTMAVLAATGPNMNTRVMPDDNEKQHPTALALSVMAQMIPHLDTMSMMQDRPQPYSLPKNTSFACDSGKTYHFWLSAYLARKRKKEGFSDEGARGAAFAANLGYQLKAPSRQGVSDYNTTKSLPRFNPIENSIRLDLTLAAAGAKFGVDEELKTGAKKQDLGAAFADFIEGAGTSSESEPAGKLRLKTQDETPEWKQVYRQLDHWNPSFIFDRVGR